MTEAEREMRRGLSALLLEAPVAVVRDLSARVQAREEELRSALAVLYADCADYIRINNLYRGDGSSAIWNQSMQQAAKALGHEQRVNQVDEI